MSRQRRWQLRQKQAGKCVSCGKKVKRKAKTANGKERILTVCSSCRKFRSEFRSVKQPTLVEPELDAERAA